MRPALLPTLALCTAACGTTHLARPLDARQVRVGASLGGPLVAFGAPVPVPLTTVGVAYGVSDQVALQAEVQPTALAFGDVGASLGAAWHPLARHRDALTVGLQATLVVGHGGYTLLADPWVAGGARVSGGVWLGGGLRNPLRASSSGTVINEQSVWAPTLFALAAFRPGGRRGVFEIEVEARWYAINACGQCLAPDYFPIASQGALGLLLGATWTLGGSR